MCEFCFEGEGVAVKISCAFGLGNLKLLDIGDREKNFFFFFCFFCFLISSFSFLVFSSIEKRHPFFAFLSFIIRLNLDATPFQLFMGT